MFDLSWLLVFIVGLLVFQVRGIKRILSFSSSIGMIVFFLGLFYIIMNNIAMGRIFEQTYQFIIGGIVSSLFYLIGANISRYNRFGKMSSRILIYVMLLVVLLWFV